MTRFSRRQFCASATVVVATAFAGEKSMSATDAPEAVPTPKPTLGLTQQLLHSTTLLEIVGKNGQLSSGTGFFFNFFNHNGVSLPAIVTNKHVIENSLSIVCSLTEAKDQRPIFGKTKKINLSASADQWIFHPDPNVDLAVTPIGERLTQAGARGENYMMVYSEPNLVPTESEFQDLTPLEDVLIVGYPDGISDTLNNVPVFRRGITATPVYLDFRGTSQFLLDAAIFPGSSGSPVFLFNQGSWATREGDLQIGSRIKLIGVVFAVAQHQTNGEIVFQPAPTQQLPSVRSLVPNNIGVCIRSTKILDFEPLLIKRGVKAPEGYTVRSKLQP